MRTGFRGFGHRVPRLTALLAVGAASIASGAMAQPANLPGNLVPQGSPIPRILPPQGPRVAPGLPGREAPVPPSETPPANVAVSGATVTGATAYNDQQLAPFLAGLTGPSVPLSQIEAARTGILNLYRSNGFVLTSVSATVGRDGQLRFSVIEGRIADVKLEGDIGPAGVQVLRFLRHLTDMQPISVNALERWLLLAQDVPGVSLRAVLRPSSGDPGGLTLVAQVERQALSGLLTADNRAFRLTGPVQALGVLEFNSFTQFGERTQVSLYHTDANTQNFGQASSEFFVGGSGLRVRVAAGYGETNPSGFLRDLGYKGFTTTFGAVATYPIIRRRQETLNASVSLEAIQTEVRTFINGQQGDPKARLSRDSLRVGRIGAEYAFEDLWAGGDRTAVNLVIARVSQGLPFLGGNSNNDPTPGRQGERVDFTKFTFDISRTQTLFRPWNGATVALRGRLTGQATPDILPPSEKFFLGGTDLNRGFYSGQVTGDNALAYTIELQLNTGFDVQAFGRNLNVASQFYAFYDRGETWENTKRDPNLRLSSQGLGARLYLTRFTEFDVEGVVRNTRFPQGGGNQGNGTGRISALKSEAVYWRVLTRF